MQSYFDPNTKFTILQDIKNKLTYKQTRYQVILNTNHYMSFLASQLVESFEINLCLLA